MRGQEVSAELSMGWVSQIDFGIPAIAVGTQVDLLVLECPPQPFNKDVVVTALSARPADLDLLSLQPGHKVSRGELAALVGMEDLRPAATAEGHLQGLQAELRVKAVGELPAEHMPGMEIHDPHQVEKTFLQRDVGDVSCPHLIHRCDPPEIDQAGKSL